MALIRTIGLFWAEEDVFWGRPGPGGTGALFGVPSNNVTAEHIDFREQIGVYALYGDYRLIYIGQTGGEGNRLFSRLTQHRKDDLARRWNRFSWFGLRRVLGGGQLSNVNEAFHPTRASVLDHIEAILIHAAEPPLNSQGGRFGEDVVRYAQIRDDRLGPTSAEMIRELWEWDS